MRIPAILFAVTLTALAPSALLAHVQLTASTPVGGSEVRAPRLIALHFDSPVDQATAAASIIMTAMPGVANHGEMPIRNFTASWSNEGKTLALKLAKPLPKGTYEVRWQAAGGDGHRMKGAVTFRVG